MLTLYGKALSRAGRCLWVLEELGLLYTHVPLDPHKGETRTARYLRYNPTAKIPTLTDGDFVLTESVAITYYLASLQPTDLLPEDVRVRARIMQWSSWALSEMEPPTTRLFRARRGAGPVDAALEAGCIADLSAALTTLETHLAQGSQYLAADAFTLADINAAGAVMVAPMLLDMAAFPAIGAWLVRLFSRPAWQRVQALS